LYDAGWVLIIKPSEGYGMFEVVIAELRYILGVPDEMTNLAISEGEVKRGCVLGLVVAPVEDLDNKVLIEVKLEKDGQAELIKPGLTIPIDGESGRFRLSST
jgi:hypothetical protein